MKYRAILHVNSLLLIFLSFGMAISSAVSFIMGDPDAIVFRFTLCAIWTFIVGYTLCKLTERKRGELDFGSSTRDGFVTVALAWLVAVVFGSLPFIPGMPLMKLGIAGGPLIIAILIGRYGYKVKLVTYTTTSANMMLREIGLVLFLASVGIKAGAGFFETVMEGDGLLYVLTGFLITILPILIVGPIARWKFKFNYFTLAGMISGTYTDPPALAYSNSICSKEAPAVGYSTVYPLSMFLRILTAQLIVLFFCG